MKPILPVPSTSRRKLSGGFGSLVRTLPWNRPETLASTIFMRMAYSSSPIFSRLSQPGMQRASTAGIVQERVGALPRHVQRLVRPAIFTTPSMSATATARAAYTRARCRR